MPGNREDRREAFGTRGKRNRPRVGALFLPWETAAGNTRKALIVHEVIHAALDKARSGFKVYQ